MDIREEVCFRLSRRLLNRATSAVPASYEISAYQNWRSSELQQKLSAFPESAIRGCDVLDFGCGLGGLTMLAASLGAHSATGIDIKPLPIQRAREAANKAGFNGRVRFAVGTPVCIPLPDDSVDTILCFDVLEHIMEYRAIFREWHRVLRPGGRVLIDWQPWTHPHAHHLWTMMPLPWVHLLMPAESLLRVCSRIYDLPEFRPRLFHLDSSGNKKPNPYRQEKDYGYLNRLTPAKFEREARAAGFRIARKRSVPFSGYPGWLKRALCSPLFCSTMLYELYNQSECPKKADS